MPKPTRPKSAAMRFLRKRYIGDNPKRIASLEMEREGLDIADKIYNLRAKAGISQRELAKRVGTTAANICRLENADYHGHSLSMLRRIAAALKMRIDVRFLPMAGK
jgi:ribosome-binding protein aMBF1 (putative translation factor)